MSLELLTFVNNLSTIISNLYNKHSALNFETVRFLQQPSRPLNTIVTQPSESVAGYDLISWAQKSQICK